MSWRRGRRGTDWKGVGTRARSGERADLASDKAAMENGRLTTGAHTITRAAVINVLCYILRGGTTVVLCTCLIPCTMVSNWYFLFSLLASCIAFMSNGLRNHHRRGRITVCAALFVRQSIVEDMAIVDTCIVVTGSLDLFSLHVGETSL